MNLELLDDGADHDFQVIFDPDTVKEIPEDAQIEDYELPDEEVLEFVSVAAETRRGLQVLRDSLRQQEMAVATEDRDESTQMSEQLQ